MATKAFLLQQPYRLPSGLFAQALLQFIVQALREQGRLQKLALANGGKS